MGEVLERRRPQQIDGRRLRIVGFGLSLLTIGSAAIVRGVGIDHAVVPTLQVQIALTTGVLLTIALGVLLLLFFPESRSRRRLRFVAVGLVALGIAEMLVAISDQPTAADVEFVFWTIAGIAFAGGLLLERPPAITIRAFGALLLIGLLLGGVLIAARRLPALSALPFLLGGVGDTLPIRYWLLASLPFGLALAAVFGAARQCMRGTAGSWLLAAILLRAGAQLHDLSAGPTYWRAVTGADLLRLAFVGVVAVGAFLELRAIATQRSSLLIALREQAAQADGLAHLRADLAAMVAHELGSPVAAVRAYADLLAGGMLDTDTRKGATAALQTEATLLNALIGDVGAIATLEREEFALRLRVLPVAECKFS